ncbi:phosphatase PAP2 family protein [Clostridium minihomine]|uniref:phosphatase PAP2 family protein n=1 Tax=Clostridium minihomine TaxID=2045012 RepID=UPI000C77C78E|nr:phosphatase PAP2 family protein [Clostridium minihomine]
MLGRIQTIDIKLLRMIQRNLRCSLFDAIMPYISLVGNVGAVWATVMVVFFLMPHYREAGVIMFFVLAACGVLTNFVLKPLVARPRPCHTYPEQKLLVACPPDYSFPSGHTMSSFGAAFIIFQANQTMGVVAFTFAFLMAFSRLYLFVHYPSDVLTGIFLGISAATEPLILVCAALGACVYCGRIRMRRDEVEAAAGLSESSGNS